MRTALVTVAASAFFLLGVFDISHGDLKTGAAALMLAAVNFLLLV